MSDRYTRDGKRGEGKRRTPENHGHGAQGAEGGKGGRQGAWTVPVGEGGRKGRDRPCRWPEGRLHPAHEVWEKPRVPNPGHEVRARAKRGEGCHRPW